ncbi:hypothetical protein T459_15813 [Capsicum annuum]|uniref:Uncharacterized protein n=1 Tax=Capsicum annuum TaxID=4072 RepID=A0A2G2Z778_CAPAN|nr:hypothetical protein T459_15813 [Capsicum annuum]
MPSTGSFLLPNASDFKCATWLSASSTDEHASPVPLSRILKELFSALRKDVDNVLDFMERLKNEEDQNVVDVYLTERLRLELAFICTYVQLSYSDLEQFEVVMTAQRQRTEELLQSIFYDADSGVGFKFDMHHVLPCFMENIDD